MFTDAQRKQGCAYWNSLVGKIVTIKFNGVTLPNEDGKCALDHPRFIEVRDDKVEADSSEYCKNSILGVTNGETN